MKDSNKIRFIKNYNGSGLIVSINDLCNFFHYKKKLTSLESIKLQRKLMKDCVTLFAARLSKGKLENLNPLYFFSYEDVFAHWIFLSGFRNHLPPHKLKKHNNFFNTIFILLDSPPDITNNPILFKEISLSLTDVPQDLTDNWPNLAGKIVENLVNN